MQDAFVKNKGIDEKAAAEAVRAFLVAIGEDPEREGLKETPERVARAAHELFGGLAQDPAAHLERTFQTEPTDDLVCVANIPVESICEHHLLPFRGVCHVVYMPKDGVITGLSKIARMVDGYARRPQVQEHLGAQIAQAMMDVLHAQGVLVVIEATHLCMSMRGARAVGAKTLTQTARGLLAQSVQKAEALRLINVMKEKS